MKATRYRLIDITPEGRSGCSRDINSHGAVALMSCPVADGPGPSLGHVWHEGSVLDLEPLADGSSDPHAINDHGLVVGCQYIGGDYPCLWKDGVGKFLYPPKERLRGSAMDVNNDGIIVGYRLDRPDGKQQCFVWSEGDCEMLVPDFLPYEYVAYASAWCVNNRGLILGQVPDYGFIKDGDDYTKISAGKDESVKAQVIGDDGVVVGHVWTGGGRYAFRLIGAGIESLGFLSSPESSAHDINDAGIIIGVSTFDRNSDDLHGFVYEHGKMYDVNSLVDNLDRYVIDNLSAINDSGQIAASAILDGESRALLLEPVR